MFDGMVPQPFTVLPICLISCLFPYTPVSVLPLCLTLCSSLHTSPLSPLCSAPLWVHCGHKKTSHYSYGTVLVIMLLLLIVRYLVYLRNGFVFQSMAFITYPTFFQLCSQAAAEYAVVGLQPSQNLSQSHHRIIES